MHNMGPAIPTKPSITQPGFTELATVVQSFLQAKAGFCKDSYIQKLRFDLAPLDARHGRWQIGQIETEQIRKVLNNCYQRQTTRHSVLGTIKDLFSWAQANRYLPTDRPTAADPIVIPDYISPPQFLYTAELRELFCSTKEVEILLEAALHAFGGLEVADLTGLGWKRVRRNRGIAISRASLCKSRLAPILPVLDAWLLPFYGCSDRLICDGVSHRTFLRWARSHNISDLSVLLRDSFCVHRLAETGDAGRTASEVGFHPRSFVQRFGPAAADVTDSDEYFSLTPRAVGLCNWPGMAKAHFRSAKS